MVNINSGFGEAEDIIKLAASVKSPLVSIAELVKNGADAGARKVVVDISKRQMNISVRDDGKGFSDDDIQNLNRLYYSNKKRNGNLTNDYNEFFAGSKGLGLFSSFFLGDEIEIITENSNFRYFVKWSRNTVPTIEKLSITGKTGTQITIRQLNEKRLNHLLKEKELKKFQFVTLKLYKSKSNLPEIKLLIDGQQIKNLNEIGDVVNHKIKVNFNYDKMTRKLNFQYIAVTEENNPEREKKRKKINEEKLALDLTKPNSLIYNEIQEHYRFDYSNKDSKKLSYQIKEEINTIIDSWPSFKSEYWIEEGTKANKFKEFGHGVKLYVNNYALYDYLDPGFDWLELSNISDNYVTSAFKLRNVLGYVNFLNFDENTEEMEISDERGGFLESTALENVMLGIRNFITRLAININVVMRSSDFAVQESQSVVPEGIKEIDTSSYSREVSKEDSFEELNENLKESTLNEFNRNLEDYNSILDRTSAGSSEEPTSNDQDEYQKVNILRQKQKTLKYGQTWNIYDSEIVHDGISPENTTYSVSKRCKIENNILNADELGSFFITYNNKLDISQQEKLKVKVMNRKKVHKSKGEIFKDTDIVVGDLYLDELHNVVLELAKIGYESYPLLSVMSLRIVLEDLVKKECQYSNISLSGSLAANLENVLDSFKARIELNKENKNKKQEIQELHKEFRGREALKNLLNLWKKDAESYSYKLNYVTHNPTPIIDSKEIYNLANNVLVPLGHLISSAKQKGI